MIVRAGFFRMGPYALRALVDRLKTMPAGTTAELVDNELRFHYPKGE